MMVAEWGERFVFNRQPNKLVANRKPEVPADDVR
jgi:hypothetical protein